MNILVIGGTRFFGVHLVRSLLKKGHNVTIATRGQALDNFGNEVTRIKVDRTNYDDMNNAFKGKEYDVVCDNICYCSNDVKCVLDNIKCNRYVLTSTCSVYDNYHINIKEKEFDPLAYELKWCDRTDFDYGEIKRQAEAATFQYYDNQQACAIRFPYVIGEDDYTKRLYFYVEHIVNSKSMNINNLKDKISFISSDEAGKFISFLAEDDVTGQYNASALGSISIESIIEYIENKVNKEAIINKDGDDAPYNYTPSFTLITKNSSDLGYKFSLLDSWFYELIDKLIKEAQNN
ncbi:NAD-dependent epimerase/dehydratase family protein [Sedimentibacter sp. zth1]|uniref:NAD-dependent epimerase/dehydratase family protein n=1 Tax=Sedimentibacter sp. zth1 TaxID=2816908 RepID=UPI001A917BA4|nr:NAD-dependent epimerase/dehydratase family protein [Sedimentibacter sp. zth1]QSX06585.1 NAD-dependent epimerase/dehydratase family protein [Sedimentibacter sp. zth1]